MANRDITTEVILFVKIDNCGERCVAKTKKTEAMASVLTDNINIKS